MSLAQCTVPNKMQIINNFINLENGQIQSTIKVDEKVTYCYGVDFASTSTNNTPTNCIWCRQLKHYSPASESSK